MQLLICVLIICIKSALHCTGEIGTRHEAKKKLITRKPNASPPRTHALAGLLLHKVIFLDFFGLMNGFYCIAGSWHQWINVEYRVSARKLENDPVIVETRIELGYMS